MPLGRKVGLGPGDIVLDEEPAIPTTKGHSSPIFGPRVLWPNGWMGQEIKMLLGTEVGLGPSHIVFDGDPATPPRRKGHCSLHFSAHVYCGQMAEWIRIPLGMEVGLGPGDVVLGGDPAPPGKGHSSPRTSIFSPICFGTVAHLSCC